MYCKKCGNKITDGDAFCSKCGAIIATESVDEVAQNAIEATPKPISDKMKKVRICQDILITAGSFLLCALLLGFMFDFDMIICVIVSILALVCFFSYAAWRGYIGDVPKEDRTKGQKILFIVVRVFEILIAVLVCILVVYRYFKEK